MGISVISGGRPQSKVLIKKGTSIAFELVPTYHSNRYQNVQYGQPDVTVRGVFVFV